MINKKWTYCHIHLCWLSLKLLHNLDLLCRCHLLQTNITYYWDKSPSRCYKIYKLLDLFFSFNCYICYHSEYILSITIKTMKFPTNVMKTVEVFLDLIHCSHCLGCTFHACSHWSGGIHRLTSQQETYSNIIVAYTKNMNKLQTIYFCLLVCV